MKVIRNRILPIGKRYHAINICGILFSKVPCTPVMMNHEEIHSAQIRELAYLFFYIWYVAEWVVRLLRHRNLHEAYRNISFEREAYDNERDMQYLRKRGRWAFLRYLNIGGNC